ncbi:MAG: hypothetical protein L0H26_04750 [Microlunatus sp.]|nr:hypothetical protein [Microlunatus sp.]
MSQRRAGSKGSGKAWPGEVTVSRQDVDEARDEAALGRRIQKSYYVTEEVADRANRAVFWARVRALAHADQAGEEIDLDAFPDSASGLVERAMWAEVLRLERLYNNGQPFREVVGGRLKPGPGQQGVSRLKQPRKPRRSDNE